MRLGGREALMVQCRCGCNPAVMQYFALHMRVGMWVLDLGLRCRVRVRECKNVWPPPGQPFRAGQGRAGQGCTS